MQFFLIINKIKHGDIKMKKNNSTSSDSLTLENILIDYSIEEIKGLIENMKSTYQNSDLLDISNNNIINNDKQVKLIKAYENILVKRIKMEESKQKKLNKKERGQQCKLFKKLLKENKNLNDISFFKKMDLSKQKDVIDGFKSMKDNTIDTIPYRIKLIQSDIPGSIQRYCYEKNKYVTKHGSM